MIYMKFFEYKIVKRLVITPICLISILFLHVSFVYGQISEGGIPPSFYDTQMTRNSVVATKVPIDFYVEDLRETDDWNARDGAPVPVSKIIPVNYTMNNSGYHSILSGGERIWRLNLKAQDAVALMLYYEDFYIPKGGRLFIYSADKMQILGAYTHITNPAGGLFATEFIGGDELVLEYVYPEANAENPRLCINEIGYGYNTAALRDFCTIITTTSGSCMVNVNCEEGEAWQNEKKGVCQTVQKIGDMCYAYLCSGTLMNNTAEDFKPLILTARHCAISDDNIVASSSDMMQWVFYFHKERGDCSNSSAPVTSKTMTGCRLLANTGTDGGSDGMLLLLNNMIPEDYDVYYNGWDRRDIAASSGVGIHHPKGDYKKISTYDKKARVYTFLSNEFTGEMNASWNVTFKRTTNGHGVTEGGSSGSPLFNENKLVVGTLSGGTSSCSDLEGLNIYGKMSYHWNRYRTDSTTRMDVWLNPVSLDVQFLAGRFRKVSRPPLNLKTEYSLNKVNLTWDAPGSSEKPVLYNVFRDNNKIGETASLSFVDDNPIDGNLMYSVSAVYANGEESSITTATIYYVKHKAPSNLKAERQNTINQEVKLSWDAPVYEQEIFWGAMDGDNDIGLKDRRPFYFGQTWSSGEISLFNEKTIKAVRFVPDLGSTYEIFISQGTRTYRQKIESSSLNYLYINSIALDVPFVIDGTRYLIVSIFVSDPGDGYPAACDNGPAIDGKGNIVSFDGEKWGKIYDERTPDEYNFNFIVSAIVSSESGSLNAGNETYGGIATDHNTDFIISNDTDVNLRVARRSTTENAVSVRSSMPGLFPEVEKYKIYQNSVSYKEVSAGETSFLDDTNRDNYYEVSAVYSNNYESEKSNRAQVVPVDIENISSAIDIAPTYFSNYINLKGSQYVTRVEVISISGKICLVVNDPDEIIDTSSLSQGFYIFRIVDNNNRQKVIKAVKY